MNESIKRFFDDVEKEESLKARLHDAFKANSGNGKSDAKEVFVKFAKSEGYDFTVSDLEDYRDEKFGGSGELTDEQLEAVAGGKTPGNPWTCVERWVSFNFTCGWDSNALLWRCEYRDQCNAAL
jgi:predicted ribosomally synthesized peptide with nif11-like leader